jgi:O-antigen ligase
MSGGVVAAAAASPLSEWWRWLRHPAFWMPVADAFAVLTALSLPWSTTLVSIFSACWIGSAALIVDYPTYFRSLKQPICAMPLALFALAAAGMLWSDASWSARLWSAGPAVKLLFLPGLFYHFQRSSRGMWVFAAFVISCALLMVLSWIVWIDPQFKLTATKNDGVPVKNYIDQTQEIALCLFAMLPFVLTLLRERRHALAALCIMVMAGFLANLVFVAFARTALIYIPAMLLLFAIRFLSLRAALLLLGGAAIVAGSIWWTSPFLRERVGVLSSEYEQYSRDNAMTSTGQRLEYWRKSVGFFMTAPVFGNGSGSTLQLFERAAIGQTGVAAEVIRNPHNQTLNVAVQWGVVGVAILWAMWLSHLLLFRGEGLVSWIGLVVVVQNVLSSLANSHIFDFHAGWMYVLGVGVAGGMILKNGGAAAQARETAGS